MSIKLMSKVFKDENLDSNKKLIMLSLADNANDEGYCYPSLNTIVSKTSLSKKTVIKHIKELQEKNLLLSQKRSRKNGGRYSSIYIIYPQISIPLLDEELLDKFDLKSTQSVEVTPPTQSVEVTPQKGIQSVEVTPKPSLTIFNHHLFNKLNKGEKDLFLEYCALRKKMKLQTTLSIQERLLNKYFNYGRNIEVIQNAINSNWRDFYEPKNFNKQEIAQTKKERTDNFIDNYFAEENNQDNGEFIYEC